MNQTLIFHNPSLSSSKKKVEELILLEAKKLLGSPFNWGSNGPFEFDSGGFVQYVFKNSIGISLPTDISKLLKIGIYVPYEDIQPGDLIFTYIGQHVGIYMGDNKFIHSPYAGEKIKISDIDNFYTSRRIIF